MADKRIDQLTAATTMGDDDLLVLQQNNQAKKLSGATLSDYIYDVVEVSNTQPAESRNKVWIKPSSEDLELAEMSDVDEVKTIVDEIYENIFEVKRFNWATIGTSSYPNGWSTGYYDTTTGAAKNSGYFIKTYPGKFIDLTGAKSIKAVPPTGYAIAVTMFKADGTVVTYGQGNTSSHPENIDKVISVDVSDYVKCVCSVGRFSGSGDDTGSARCQNSDFVSSILFDIYYKNDESIETYFENELTTTIASVKAEQTEPTLVFPLVTDIHYLSVNSMFDKCIKNLKAFCKKVKCDFLLSLGDNTDGDVASSTTVERNLYMLSRFNEIGIPYYHAVGNHDTNKYISNDALSSGQIFESYLSDIKDVQFDLTAGEKNFYKDFSNLGIRLVVLDANHDDTYAYSSRTATWLTETALDTSYIVILAEHLSSISSQNWNASSPINHMAVTNALQSFVSGGGTLIQLCGHSHADYYFTTPWLTVFSTCQKFESTDTTTSQYQGITGYVGSIVSPARTEGTATEDSWSVVVVKPVSRSISFIRFGAGDDRTFTY